jgi:hypothetical protein
MLPVAEAVARGPTAMALEPEATESPRVELAWKYLIPAPFASAFRTLTLLLVVDRPVERELRLLALVLTPVERDATPLWVVLIPVDAEVDSDVTALLVVDRPVDSEPTPL